MHGGGGGSQNTHITRDIFYGRALMYSEINDPQRSSQKKLHFEQKKRFMRRKTKQEASFNLQAPQTLAMRAFGSLSVGCTDRVFHIVCYERQRMRILGMEIWDPLPCI